MSKTTSAAIRQRVKDAAEAVLEQNGVVTAIDVLVGIRWLTPSAVSMWEQGRVDSLEGAVQVGRAKIAQALTEFLVWAEVRGLDQTEGEYVSRTRNRDRLFFTVDRNEALEQAIRIHWMSPNLSARQKKAVETKAEKPADLVVIQPLRDFTCEECGGSGNLLIMEGQGALCMTCADMEHLVFLASGNAALTRRAKKESRLTAVVVRFSRARKRYERQGILVEEDALDRAEEQCLADADLRAARREREAVRRDDADVRFLDELTVEIRRLFPGCPETRAAAIAAHTAARGSGRVGRSAAARDFDSDAIGLAVAASVRHEDTNYDDLLMSGVDRVSARSEVHAEVARILETWRRR